MVGEVSLSSRNAIPPRFVVRYWLAYLMGQPFLQCSLKAPACVGGVIINAIKIVRMGLLTSNILLQHNPEH